VVKVSSPDKLLYPDDGITKAQVVEHYATVAPALFPWVDQRPVTVQRFPRGIAAQGFMQKNAADHYPATIERYTVPKREGGDTVYPVLTTPDDVVYLANQNTITFHTWTATTSRPDQPDWFLLDLDPDEGASPDERIAAVRRATRLAGDVLRRFGMESMVVATGSKGFHVRARIEPGPSHDEVDLAGRAAAGLVAAADPELATVEFLKRERGGRVFVDWLRNGPIATSVVPWSLRPRPGAPVAVPIAWDELDAVTPDSFTLAPGSLAPIADRLALDLPLPPPAPLPIAELAAAADAAGVDLATTQDRFGRRSGRS